MSSARPPNILFLLTDQMRATALGCAGVEQVHTPNLDVLAAQGTRFSRAVANTPACSPSRASLLTGKHVLSHGIVGNDVPLGTHHTSLAHALNNAGYRSGYIGKWHLDEADRGIFIPPGPRRQGFDDLWAVANCNHNYLRAFYHWNDDPKPRWHEGYEPDAQTDLAIDYLRGNSQAGAPFFLTVSWGPPHCPYRQLPSADLERYNPENISFLPNAVDAAVQSRESIGKRPYPADLSRAGANRQKRELLAGYYAHATALDRCVGRLLRCLEEEALADNTLVVFTSDHGDMLFSQNRGWKSKPWRESVNVPLIIRWPGRVPAGRVSQGLIGIVDFMPTLLGLAGAAIPSGVEGLDLSAMVRGDEAASPESVFINFPVIPAWFTYGCWRGVLTKMHTFVRNRTGPWLLYHDAADPFQLENLVNRPDAEALQAALDGHLQQWMHQTRDPFESSRAVADRYLPGHQDNVAPAFYNEEILRGYREDTSNSTM